MSRNSISTQVFKTRSSLTCQWLLLVIPSLSLACGLDSEYSADKISVRELEDCESSGSCSYPGETLEVCRLQPDGATWECTYCLCSEALGDWAESAGAGETDKEDSVHAGAMPSPPPTAESPAPGSSPGLFADPKVLFDERTHEELFVAVSIVSGSHTFVAEVDGGVESLGATMTLSDKEAVETAESYLNDRNARPADAVLGSVTSVFARMDGSEVERLVGYSVRFTREINGLPVRGNFIEDHIVVLVGTEGVLSHSRYWPEIIVDPSMPATDLPLLSIGRALELAAVDILGMLRTGESFHIIEAVPVYGTLGRRSTRLLPAFELRGRDGSTMVVDAWSGALLM